MLGNPLLENTKVTKFRFHDFDRCEIHVHDFEEIITGIFIICRCPSSHNLIVSNFLKSSFSKFPIFNFSNSRFDIFRIITISQKVRYTDFQKKQMSRYPYLQNYYVCKMCSYFLILLKYFCKKGPMVHIWSHFWLFQKCSKKYCNMSRSHN